MLNNAEHPYSPAIESNGAVYVSGCLSVDAHGNVAVGERPSLDAALEVLQTRLATVGAALQDVVKLTYFVTDIALRDAANAQLIQRFAEPRPARTFVEVSRLPYGATVEIDAVAVKGLRRSQDQRVPS